MSHYSSHSRSAPEHAEYGTTIMGSRWYRGEPIVEDGQWLCPLDGGVMEYTGWTWPMNPPGLHHVCANEDCGFTAALGEDRLEELGISRGRTG